MEVRRIVTGFDPEGRGIVAYDGMAPRTHDFRHIPGFSNTVIWAMDDLEQPVGIPADPTLTLTSSIPEPGGVRMIVIRFPPDSVLASADRALAEAEQEAALPGLGDRFDPARPGFVHTPTVNYAILLEGELWLELDSGEEVCVRPMNMVVENGTWHAWRNRTSAAAVLAAVSVGIHAG